MNDTQKETNIDEMMDDAALDALLAEDADVPRGRVKPMFAEETVSFDVIERTNTTAVLEFIFDKEAEAFFGGLIEAGYQGPRGRLRVVNIQGNNAFEIGVPAHIYMSDFKNVTWSPTSDTSDGVVVDGEPG